MNGTKKAWINAIFLAATLAVNTLGGIGLINGLSQKQISDMYVTLITPSPSTFSIWGVIYTLLLISAVVMIVRKNDPYYQRAVDQISVPFRISCLFNMAWIVLFSYLQIELSVVFILGFAITLALICLKLARLGESKRWLLPVTFGLYTGWLTIATVVNVAAALVKLNWDGFSIAAETWGIIILAVAVVLVLVILLKIRNAVYPLPIAWAGFGIYQFLTAPDGFKGQYALLQNAALIAAAVLVLLAVLQLYRNRWTVLSEPDTKRP